MPPGLTCPSPIRLYGIDFSIAYCPRINVACILPGSAAENRAQCNKQIARQGPHFLTFDNRSDTLLWKAMARHSCHHCLELVLRPAPSPTNSERRYFWPEYFFEIDVRNISRAVADGCRFYEIVEQTSSGWMPRKISEREQLKSGNYVLCATLHNLYSLPRTYDGRLLWQFKTSDKSTLDGYRYWTHYLVSKRGMRRPLSIWSHFSAY